VNVSSSTDNIPLATTDQQYAFTEMAARRFKFLFEGKVDIPMDQDPVYREARSRLFSLLKWKQPPRSYGRTYQPVEKDGLLMAQAPTRTSAKASSRGRTTLRARASSSSSPTGLNENITPQPGRVHRGLQLRPGGFRTSLNPRQPFDLKGTATNAGKLTGLLQLVKRDNTETTLS
jgi:hypothetical protein